MAIQDNNEKLVQVNIWPKAVYFLYRLNVPRGMHGKTKGHVDEIIAVGIPIKKVESYCRRHNLIITNKAVYEIDLDHPILYREGDSPNYSEKKDEENVKK